MGLPSRLPARSVAVCHWHTATPNPIRGNNSPCTPNAFAHSYAARWTACGSLRQVQPPILWASPQKRAAEPGLFPCGKPAGFIWTEAQILLKKSHPGRAGMAGLGGAFCVRFFEERKFPEGAARCEKTAAGKRPVAGRAPCSRLFLRDRRFKAWRKNQPMAMTAYRA